MSELKNITPEALTKLVSFYRDPDGFQKEYGTYNLSSMQAKQAEGSSYLFNLLNTKGIALLADEVGMGKTIQSLAVCAALWRQKPDAQILILAPRNEIAHNWQREYETFINVHYKVNDDIVKSLIGNHPINPGIFCSNLYDLVAAVNEQWGRLYIGKISSFSGLLSKKEDIEQRLDAVGIEGYGELNPEDSINCARTIAESIRKKLKAELKNGQFDLIIIDEAHYFRNKDGDSLRVNVAEEFFGKGEDKLAKRILLLTATPNHSSSNNIRSIVSYFTPEYNDSNYSDILNDICLRRFRRLSAKGKIKYNYRKEVPQKADFKDELAEMFFGVYQKQLVRDYVKGKKQGSRRNILGFLEGTEFIPHQAVQVKPEEEKELKEGQDFSKGSDGEILLNLSNKFKEIFGIHPSHPKYDLLVNNLIAPGNDLTHLNEKKLIFVRRIPSVREIASRVNHRYDEILLKKISKALGKELFIPNADFRIYYENQIASLLGARSSEEEEEEEAFSQESGDVEEIQGVPISKVMDLFKTLKKSGPSVRSTHASNFRLRFTRSKPSIFNVFFVPPSDYKSEEYAVRIRRTELKGKGLIDDHYLSCLYARVESAKSKGVALQVNSLLGGRDTSSVNYKDDIVYRIPTLLTLYWEHLKEVNDPERAELEALYDGLSIFEKEAFSSFIEKGILLASPALIDLYVAFLNVSIKSELKSYDLYLSFVEEVKKSLGQTCIPQIISLSLKNFKILCEKVFNITTNNDLLAEEWKIFHDAQPAYAYSGDTKNQRVMSSFNTPFFPDVLISTSVLQEGVNLQYFCDKIIHYGIAWTPGDNEQRVGRIDRMFSQTERNLEKDESSYLEIAYPYLHNTIDQDHLANFISKKYFAENLIDKCQAFAGRTNLDPEDFNYENWQEYFRIPEQFNAPDPYDVQKERFNAPYYEVPLEKTESNIVQRIVRTFQDKNIPVFEPIGKSSLICVLNPILSSGREQPVFIEMNYDPKATDKLGFVTHYLTLKTPLGRKNDVKKFEAALASFEDYENHKALTCKICYDSAQPVNSIWGVYMKVDLPVFMNHSEDPLSTIEILKNFEVLTEYADHVELTVTGKDITLKHEGTQVNEFKMLESDGLRSNTASTSIRQNWKQLGEYVCLVKDEPQRNVRERWELNHQRPFIKYRQHQMFLPYHAHDLQNIEFDFLEGLI
jgi:superfamily II DNA or RNA helicase